MTTYGVIRKIGKTGNKVLVGKYCSLGNNVQAIMTGHSTKTVSTYPFHYMHKGFGAANTTKHYGNVVIGNDVYIGNDVTLLGGITIGDGAIIAAGSLVASDVESYRIYAGNPAKHIRRRFSMEQIHALLKIKWWDWDEDKIQKFIPLLTSLDIDKFIGVCNVGS